MFDPDQYKTCPECGEDLQVWLPILITPGTEYIDTGMIDYEATPKWTCGECGFEHEGPLM